MLVLTIPPLLSRPSLSPVFNTCRPLSSSSGQQLILQHECNRGARLQLDPIPRDLETAHSTQPRAGHLQRLYLGPSWVNWSIKACPSGFTHGCDEFTWSPTYYISSTLGNTQYVEHTAAQCLDSTNQPSACVNRTKTIAYSLPNKIPPTTRGLASSCTPEPLWPQSSRGRRISACSRRLYGVVPCAAAFNGIRKHRCSRTA